MGASKWFYGLLGWVLGGPIGGLLGYILGATFENIEEAKDAGTGSATGRGYTSAGSASGRGSAAGSSASRGYSAQEQRNSFLVSLLVLASAVIRADGKTQRSELDYVRSFVRQNFGAAAVDEAMRILEELNRKHVIVREVGAQIAGNMNYSQRLQLFHFLAQLAAADGEFSASEKTVLESIAAAIRISAADVNSVIAMFYKDTASAYDVLEIKPDASDAEVKAAYRRMAMKNHPDKVATLGPDVQKAAADKFRQIQEAYETIKRDRGMN